MYNNLIVGFGKVGSSLFNVLKADPQATIFVVDPLKNLNKTWTQNLSPDSFYKEINELPPKKFELIAICVPDDQIEKVVSALLNFPLDNSFVFHTSGTQTTECLIPLKEKGAQIGSLHPLQTFNQMFLPTTIWDSITCTFQGDAALYARLKALFEPFKTRIVTVTQKQKQMLHLTATITANYQVALYSWAQQLLKEVDLPENTLNDWLSPLIVQVGQNLQKQAVSKILSGPLQRGDLNTIKYHLKLLNTKGNKSDALLYRLLGLKILENADFNIQNRQELKRYLESNET